MTTVGLHYAARGEGGLRIGATTNDGIRLGLGRAHAEARARSATAVPLPWPEPGTSRAERAWSISHWATVKQWRRGGSSETGIALALRGTSRAACADLIGATSGLGRRVAERGQTTATVPIVRSVSPVNTLDAERDTLRALVDLLACRADLRDRLDEPARMRRLADDLNTGALALPHPRAAVARDRIDIVTAMSQRGLVHERRRPLPGDHIVPCAAAHDRVLDAVHANPHRAGRPIDPAIVAEVVHAAYCAVAPWPFEALVR